LSVILVAACTVCALAPAQGHGWLARLSFFLGSALGELPQVALVWLTCVAALAISEGDALTPIGMVAVALAVVTVIGITVVLRRALRSAPVLVDALDAGLGLAWRLDAPTPEARLARGRTSARAALVPFLPRLRGVERIADLRYGDAAHHNLLDVYRSNARPVGAPVLVHLHGGSFTGGGKSHEALPLLRHLARRGWVCVSTNYRLGGPDTVPDHLIDVKRILAWVRAHGEEYGADASTLVVAGSSAGAHLAAMAALTGGDLTLQPGFEAVDTSVSAAVCLYGYYGQLNDRPDTSPFAHLRPDAPPVFVVHGELDSVVSIAGARRFADELRSASSSPVVFAELPGAQHSFDVFGSVRFEAVTEGIDAFVTWVHATTMAPGRSDHRS